MTLFWTTASSAGSGRTEAADRLSANLISVIQPRSPVEAFPRAVAGRATVLLRRELVYSVCAGALIKLRVGKPASWAPRRGRGPFLCSTKKS